MLQWPAYIMQYPLSTTTTPTSFLLPSQWPQSHNQELLLAMEESAFTEKCNEIRKINSNLIVIGKTTAYNEKKKLNNGADADEDVDIVEESDSEEFGRETG